MPEDQLRQAEADAAERSEAPYLQIGQLASRVTLSLRTVRFYDEAGLVLPAGRTAGGFRLYTEDAVERLLLIKQMKPLGFTLDEMRLLIEARDVLRDDGADAGLRHEMHERLEMFSAAAAERCRQLAEQLELAKAFARTLDDEVGRRPRRRARGPDGAGHPSS